MVFPYKISFNEQSINDKTMKKVGGFIFSIIVILGINEKFITGNLKSFELMIVLLIVLGSAILFHNLISSKKIKIIFASLSIIALFVYGINILIVNQNHKNLGWLYLTLSFTFFVVFIFIILFIQKKLLIFEKRKESKYNSYIMLLILKELKKLSLFTFFWIFSLSLNWFTISVPYHSFYVFLLSLIFLFMFFYLCAKGEVGKKITKAITGFVPLCLLAFISDYIIWRRLVYGYLPIDKTLGIIDYHKFGLWSSIGLAFFFTSVTIIVGILMINSMIKIFSLMKFEEELKKELFIKNLKVKYSPSNYLSNLTIFYPFPLFILFFYIGLYLIPILFFIFAYHSLFKMKKEVIIDYSKIKNLQEENIIKIFIKANLLTIWIIIIPILLVSLPVALIGGISYMYYLVTHI